MAKPKISVYNAGTPEYHKEWCQLNPDKCTEYSRRKYKRLRDKILLKFGGRCNSLKCKWLNDDGSIGCTNEKCLQIDHVNNDGHIEKKERKSLFSFMKKVLEDNEGNYQLLCANCNWLKRL